MQPSAYVLHASARGAAPRIGRAGGSAPARLPPGSPPVRAPLCANYQHLKDFRARPAPLGWGAAAPAVVGGRPRARTAAAGHSSTVAGVRTTVARRLVVPLPPFRRRAGRQVEHLPPASDPGFLPRRA